MPRPAHPSGQRHDSSNNPFSHPPSTAPPSYKNHEKQTDPKPPPPPSPEAETTVRSSLLQPRVAVALGLSAKWHPLLFICRLLSIVPALWYGVPVVIGLLAQAILFLGSRSAAACGSEDKAGSIPWLRGYSPISSGVAAEGLHFDFETRLKITEIALGIVWCASSAYLSFFFTDCLMSRWLLLYTPQATLVRLLTINATNLYLTSQTLHLTGGGTDERLFLPAWITIATTLTGLYHLTQRKINIRKETSMSISVFSIASFISMVSLLAQVQADRPDWPAVPMVEIGLSVMEAVGRLRSRVLEFGGEREGL